MHLTRSRAATVVAVLALPLALAACSNQPTPTVTPSSTSTQAPSTTAATPTAETSPTSPSSPSTPATASSGKRDKAALKAALLDENDVPAGFSIDTSDPTGDSPTSKTTDPKCKTFNDLMNLDVPPGSTANAQVSMDGGQNGPLITESLDALASQAAVTDLTGRLKTAVKNCRTITLTVPGGKPTTMTVATVAPPKVGQSAAAARLTGSGGSLDGLEMTMVWADSNDVLLTMTFMNALPDEIDEATTAAHEKAQAILGATTRVS